MYIFSELLKHLYFHELALHNIHHLLLQKLLNQTKCPIIAEQAVFFFLF